MGVIGKCDVTAGQADNATTPVTCLPVGVVHRC